jgi:hypothetical protein
MRAAKCPAGASIFRLKIDRQTASRQYEKRSRGCTVSVDHSIAACPSWIPKHECVQFALSLKPHPPPPKTLLPLSLGKPYAGCPSGSRSAGNCLTARTATLFINLP